MTAPVRKWVWVRPEHWLFGRWNIGTPGNHLGHAWCFLFVEYQVWY